ARAVRVAVTWTRSKSRTSAESAVSACTGDNTAHRAALRTVGRIMGAWNQSKERNPWHSNRLAGAGRRPRGRKRVDSGGRGANAGAGWQECAAGLLGQDQLVIAGMAQPVELVAMLDQDLALALEQGAAVEDPCNGHQLDRALRQMQRAGAEQDRLGGHHRD